MNCPAAPTRPLALLLLIILLTACSGADAGGKVGEAATAPTVAQIARAQSAHGTTVFDSAVVSFTFRDRRYRIEQHDTLRDYSRTYADTLERIRNARTERRVGDRPTPLDEKATNSVFASINSVRYFFMLPEPLTDAAVNAQPEGRVAIKGQTYDRVRVSFEAAGGGEDFDDIFYYYFNTRTGEIDYLAYSYAEDDGRGLRFREAINKRRVDGLLVQDYLNYRPAEGPAAELIDLAGAFERGELLELSRIENTDVVVKRLR